MNNIPWISPLRRRTYRRDDPLIGFELEGKFICPSTRVTSGNYFHLRVWNERPVERVMAPARDGYTLLWNCQLAGMKILPSLFVSFGQVRLGVAYQVHDEPGCFFFFSLPFLFLDFDSASPSKVVEVCRLEGLDGGNYFYGGRRQEWKVLITWRSLDLEIGSTDMRLRLLLLLIARSS